MFNRRSLLRTAAFSAANLSLGSRLNASTEKNAMDPGIAIQLYSVRNDCSKNFDDALAWAKKAGFDAVEFAGYYNYGGRADALQARLDELGLKAEETRYVLWLSQRQVANGVQRIVTGRHQKDSGPKLT